MSDSSSGSDIEEYSSVDEPTLLEKFRRILDQYRNDVQIIKEFVQNADDAKAVEMKLLYEGRVINEEIPDEKPYRKFLRAPALVFYNDALFSEKDWKGIMSINKSLKTDEPLKIGRFGLGFKSIFHLTDFPCIISGKKVLFYCPRERDVTKVCTMVDLRKIRKGKQHDVQDYLKVLDGTFGFTENTLDTGFYQGTMFWFPLRQAPSRLSENVYTDTEVNVLLQSFLSESHRSLIFLKTLCSVAIFVNLQHRDDLRSQQRMSGSTEFISELESMNFGKETACHFVKINNYSNNLEHIRKEVTEELESTSLTIPKESTHWTHDFEIITETKCQATGIKVAKSRWLVVNYLKGGEISSRTRDLMNIDNIRTSHLVGCAVPVNEKNEYSNTDGHVFCYQPLPQENTYMTGLPVHLNGFLALTQDKRQVRWPDEEGISRAHGDKKIEWNIALTTEIMPDCYSKLIDELVGLCNCKHNPRYLVNAVS